jgi:hypothetical protein
MRPLFPIVPQFVVAFQPVEQFTHGHALLLRPNERTASVLFCADFS